MSRSRFNLCRFSLVAAVLVALIALGSNNSSATDTFLPPPVSGEPDLSAESQTLEKYLGDVIAYDKAFATLSGKNSITRNEFEPLQQTGTLLRTRLSDVQATLKAAIAKLKRANLWDNLDDVTRQRVNDSKFRLLLSENSFKAALEDLSSGASSRGAEITGPLDKLRTRLANNSQQPDFRQPGQTIFASYTPAPKFARGLKCDLAWVSYGITGAFSKKGPSANSVFKVDCYCNHSGCGPNFGLNDDPLDF